MHIYNWKKTSDFLTLLGYIRDSEEESIIQMSKHVTVGWFHIALIQATFPEKKPLFVTRDERAKKLFKHTGYRVFSTIQDIHAFLPEWFQIMQENLSPMEYVSYNIWRTLNRLYWFARKLKPNHADVFEVKHSSWYFLVLAIVVVLLLMIGIVSLTSPHASVIITPQTSIQNAIRNVVFVPQDEIGAPEQIPLQKDIFPFELQKKYPVNTYDPTSLSRAEGAVRITNSGPDALSIRPQTRIVSGALTYRTQAWTRIPWALGSQPGEVVARVIADPAGNDGMLQGSRGNITQNTSLLFPGLSAKDHENIVIVANENFTGWADTFKPLLTQGEYDRIQKIFHDEILADAQAYESKHYNKNADFIPLPTPDAFTVLDVTIGSDSQVGSAVSSVTFSGKANFMVYLYHQPTLRKILLETAKNHLLENTESLVEISDSPPDIIATLSKTDDPFMIKATAEIPVQILYDFSSPIGQKTIQNILSDLLGADTDRAEKTLLNHPYVKSVDIRLTPFWTNNLPGSLDKIYIKVEKPDN